MTLEKASQSCHRGGLSAFTVDIMRRLLMLLFSFALLSGIASARPSVGDWQPVQDIPAGWQITVVTEFTFPCTFAQASDRESICTLLQRPGATVESREIHARRDRTQEVRVERRDGANMLAGAGGGGAFGAILGAVLVAGARGPAGYLFVLGGASLGAPHRSRFAYPSWQGDLSSACVRQKLEFSASAESRQRNYRPNFTMILVPLTT